MTPHNQAKKEQIAPVVLMPGDPLRAKWIAETFFTNPVLVNEVRGMLAYTGSYQQKPVTVMGHGMGMASIGIYSFELFSPDFYDVQVIIRVGSCGSLTSNLNVNDLVIAHEAYSETIYPQLIGTTNNNGVLTADPGLIQLAQKWGQKLQLPFHTTRCYSTDAFYGVAPVRTVVAKTQADVVEMEAFALYANANKLHKKALCLLTVSDSLVNHQGLTPHQRQTTFHKMIKLALSIRSELV